MDDSRLYPQSRILRWACWATLLAALIYGVGLYWATRQFNMVFESFGADLPLITRIFVKAGYLWGLLPVTAAVLLGCLVKSPHYPVRYDGRYLWGMFALWGVMLSGFCIWVYAMYSPIFFLGAVAD